MGGPFHKYGSQSEHLVSAGEGPAQPMSATSSVVEELTQVPTAEVLGEIKAKPKPSMGAAGASVSVDEGPPPWETGPEYNSSDARAFVTVPDTWVLRWVNPKLLDQVGWRYWRPVSPSDPRVHLKVDSMKSVDNLIRKGFGGDILAYMPQEWYDKRQAIRNRRVQETTQSSITRLETLKDEMNRGSFGPHVRLESVRHPTHTIADGRTMLDP